MLGLRLPGRRAAVRDAAARNTRDQLAPGDVIVLYTDGITEAMDSDGELFGDDGAGARRERAARPRRGRHPRARRCARCGHSSATPSRTTT